MFSQDSLTWELTVTYDRRSKKEEALLQANNILVPLLGIGRRLYRVLESETGRRYGIYVHNTTDKRLHIVVLDLPASHPLVIAVYSSAQTSRPTSPKQLATRLGRLRREVGKLRGKLFSNADIVYVYVSRRNITRGAYRQALRSGVIVAVNPSDARRRIAKYLAKRYHKLLSKLAGKRIWGELPLLAYTLAILSKSLLGGKPEETLTLLNPAMLVKGSFTGDELLNLLQAGTSLQP